MNAGDSEQSPSTSTSIAALTLAWAKSRNFKTGFSRQTTSTNTIAKARVSSALEKSEFPTLFLTERQTAGRGRADHAWSTSPDALLSSWSYPLTYAPQPILSPLVGLALFNAARSAFQDVAFSLKAPNDLYVGSEKIAGLLIETVMMGDAVTCVIGLGFNSGDAPAPLAAQAAGLSQYLRQDVIEAKWPLFLTALSQGFVVALDQARNQELRKEAREELLAALNLFALAKESVLDVGPLGQIQTASRLIDWHEL